MVYIALWIVDWGLRFEREHWKGNNGKIQFGEMDGGASDSISSGCANSIQGGWCVCCSCRITNHECRDEERNQGKRKMIDVDCSYFCDVMHLSKQL